ncbi:MAG TPA: hypothetical protein VGX78_08540, partial [Pirellulales bacterium]|nr:hypothetical protein [Pirellulales bacterium]
MGKRMEMATYQNLLPAGLKLQRPWQGAGFLGDVFEATDTRHGERESRVVQFLPPAAPSEEWGQWPGWKLQLEAWLAPRVGLQLPHVSMPLECGSTPLGGLYAVCRQHDEPLSQFLAERGPDPLDAATVMAIVEQLLAGLAELHARHLVHGDLRPRNIFLDGCDAQSNHPAVWLDGSVSGVLAAWSHHRVEDPDARAYRSLGVLLPEATLSATEDLRALALTACELALGGRRELLELADGARSVEAFWARVEPALRQRLTRYRRGRRFRNFLAGTNPARRLVTVVALLLGQPLAGRFGMPRPLRHASTPCSDARDVVRRLREWDTARRALERRGLLAALAVAVISCLSSGHLLIRARNQGKELAEARRKLVEVGDQLADAKATIASHETRNTEWQRRRDEAVVREKNEELREIRAALNSLREQVVGPPAPESEHDASNIDQSAAEIGRRAQDAWKGRFTGNHSYEPKDATRLYEDWRTKEPAVAARIKQWRGDVDALRRRAKPWLASDAELKRLRDAALGEPWEPWLGRADQRLATLHAAARTWEKCAVTGADPDRVIANEPEPDAQRVLKGWYQALITRTDWKLQLVSGASAAGAGKGTTRVVTVQARTHDATEKHEWNSADGAKYETEHTYDSSASPSGTLSFQWSPGTPIELTLEGARSAWALGTYRPDIIFERFDGPLAPWLLNIKGTLTSGDGTTTLSVRVVD